jgi:hypothetical protein
LTCPAFCFFGFFVLFAHKSLYIFANRSDFVIVTMMIVRNRFNTYFAIFLGLFFAAGCHTAPKEPKCVATLRVHIQVDPQPMDFSREVPIYRAKPVLVPVDRSPFLTEANVKSAEIVDVPGGGFSLQIEFGRQGKWLLEQYTTTNPGRRMAIFSAFTDGKITEERWLGAPRIVKRIGDGKLVFAPDATREEVEIIVSALNAQAEKNKEDLRW